MPTKPAIARIWRGRTRRDVADTYEQYVRIEGISPLEKTALGVQLLREDREEETWFTTISYWPDMQAARRYRRETYGVEVPWPHLSVRGPSRRLSLWSDLRA